MKKVILLVLLLSLFSAAAQAHSGRTDSRGGHHDRKNGGYHYHHGMPAHDHPGGVCPYSVTPTPKPTPKPTPRPTPKPTAKPTPSPTPTPTPKPKQTVHADSNSPPSVYSESYLTTTANLNMRTDPSMNGSVITTIPKGTSIPCLGKKGNWYSTFYSGSNGWVYADYVNIKEVQPTATVFENYRSNEYSSTSGIAGSAAFLVIGTVAFPVLLKLLTKNDYE